MKTKQENTKITDEELKRAVGKFVKDGGIIQKLPDQKSASHRLVGGKWSTTEMGSGII